MRIRQKKKWRIRKKKKWTKKKKRKRRRSFTIGAPAHEKVESVGT